jgi:MFS family permease
MGSIGAAIGPFLTGYIAEAAGFDGVFGMLYMAAILAGALLIRLVGKEVRSVLRPRGWERFLALEGQCGPPRRWGRRVCWGRHLNRIET